MRAFAHGHCAHKEYFHLHPWHSVFTLLASVGAEVSRIREVKEKV